MQYEEIPDKQLVEDHNTITYCSKKLDEIQSKYGNWTIEELPNHIKRVLGERAIQGVSVHKIHISNDTQNTLNHDPIRQKLVQEDAVLLDQLQKISRQLDRTKRNLKKQIECTPENKISDTSLILKLDKKIKDLSLQKSSIQGRRSLIKKLFSEEKI